MRTKILTPFLVAMGLCFLLASTATAVEVRTRSAEMRDYAPCYQAGTIEYRFSQSDWNIMAAHLAGNPFVRLRVTLGGANLPPNPRPPLLCQAIQGGARAADTGLPRDHANELVAVGVTVSDVFGAGAPPDGVPDLKAYVHGAGGNPYLELFITEIQDGLGYGAWDGAPPWIKIGLYEEVRLYNETGDGVDRYTPSHPLYQYVNPICADVRDFSGLSLLTISTDALPQSLAFSGDNQIGHFFIRSDPIPDDPYENNDTIATAAPLTTGAYDLIAADPDYFRVALRNGDRLRVIFDTAADHLVATLYDPDAVVLGRMTRPGSRVIQAQMDGDYIIGVIPGRPAEGARYSLYIEQQLRFGYVFPVKPTGAWRTGISLFEPEGIGEGRKHLVLVDEAGRPAAFHAFAPGDTPAGGVEDDFQLSAPAGRNTYLKVYSDTPLQGTQAAVALDHLMLGGNLMAMADGAGRIVFPHIAHDHGWQTTLGLINTGNQEETVLRTAYGESGHSMGDDTVVLGAGQRLRMDTRLVPLLARGVNAMHARTVSGRAVLLGYIEFHNPTLGARGRALVPLPGAGAAELVVPHVAHDEVWRTGIAVMNPDAAEAAVTCRAYDRGGALLAETRYRLAPGQNLVRMVDRLIPDAPAAAIAAIRIAADSGAPITGLVIYGSRDHNQLAGMALAPPQTLPVHLTQAGRTEGWWTGIGLLNTGDRAADFHFSLLDEHQAVIAETHRTLDADASLAVTVAALFPDALHAAARYLRVDSPDTTHAGGMYLIGTDDGLRLMGDMLK